MNSVLRGNSNEEVKVMDVNNLVKEVNKYFYNNFTRAESNIQKQQNFKVVFEKDCILQSCKCTYVKKSNSICLNMPYISGIVAEEYAYKANVQVAKNLNMLLTKYLKENLANAIEDNINKDVYLAKLWQIKKNVSDDYKPYIKLGEHLIQSITHDLTGYCHGDLTLSNIICKNEETFVLIDFLQTFKESPIQDLAKVQQEREYGWSLREKNNSVINRGLIFFRTALPDPYEIVAPKYHTLLSLNELVTLLRIAPYIKDSLTSRWLLNSLQKYQRNLKR